MKCKLYLNKVVKLYLQKGRKYASPCDKEGNSNLDENACLGIKTQ